jgi:outer membrane receptor protein involved in Fe transport
MGVEYRKEGANYRPDATVASGELGSGIDGLPLSGHFDVFELFGETRIPLLNEIPFFQYLGLEGAVRYSKYSTIGSVLTFKAGGEWAPIEDIRFRGLFQRAVRAPNLIELYQGRSSGSAAYTDPCDFNRVPSAAVKAFCIAQGVPAVSINSFQQDDVVNTISGGNASLRQEKSNTLTLGVVAQPRAIPGLSASLDYYQIKVDEAIDTITPQTIINLCFASLNISDPSCQRISRLSNGRIRAIESFNANIATFKVDGLDGALSYRFALPGSVSVADGEANLTARLNASWQFKREKQSSPTSAPVDCAGKFGGGICSGQGIPIVLGFKALAGLDYASGPLTVSLQARYFGKATPIDAANVVKEIKPRLYLDLASTVSVTQTVNFNFVVDNVLDTKPPVLGFNNGGDTNTDAAVFDVLGRRYFVRATVKF